MTLEQKERRKAVLRYAVSVPEWNLALKHRAAAELTKCASLLMSVSQMMLATDAEDRFYPGRLDYGMSPTGYAKAVSDAEYSLVTAASALETVVALADESNAFPLISSTQTGGLDGAMGNIEAAYNSGFGWLADLCREVPKDAQKPIEAGRLKGKTDINPMWRIKKLTELFGPAGMGWKFDPPVFEEKTGAKGEVVVQCFTNLYVRQDDGEAWSAPIPGVGGSMLIALERDGLRTDDDAYKKAYTDAQSVACKALGIGANVYWKDDSTKYTQLPDIPAPVCACCGKKIIGIKTKDGKKMTAE